MIGIGKIACRIEVKHLQKIAGKVFEGKKVMPCSIMPLPLYVTIQNEKSYFTHTSSFISHSFI